MDGAERVKFFQGLWGRLDRESRISLGAGLVLAVVALFINTLLALAVGMVSAAVVGYLYPTSPMRVGFLVAVPVIVVAFLAGLLRGFSGTVLLIVLVPSFIVPMALARAAADVRRGWK